MKKFVRFSKILFSLIVISISFLSCNIELTEEIKLSPPTCNADTGSSVTLSIKKYNSNTKYINIYRKDTTNSNQNEPFINIGIIFPENLPNEKEVNTFTDKLVKNGHSYTYYARIFDGSTYYKTYESSIVKIPNDADCYDSSATFSYNTVSFSYDEANFSLTVDSTITEPTPLYTNDTNYKPVLILSSKTKTESLELHSLTDSTIIQLRDILPKHFLDTQIQIKAVCGQKTEKNESSTVKRIYWTESADVIITGIGIKNNTLLIPSSKSPSGYDYS